MRQDEKRVERESLKVGENVESVEVGDVGRQKGNVALGMREQESERRIGMRMREGRTR